MVLSRLHLFGLLLGVLSGILHQLLPPALLVTVSGMNQTDDSLRHIFVFPAQAGTHFRHRHRPEFILGPAQGRTRGPVWQDF